MTEMTDAIYGGKRIYHVRKKHAINLFFVTSIVCLLFTIPALCPAADAMGRLNNSDLIPEILPDDQVRMEGASPDWVKTLIMAEVRLETATPQGTLKSSVAVLDHYAEMGVNGLWITPIFGRNGHRSIGYGNRGPQEIQSDLSGTQNEQESLAAVREFVAEAHRRNIRVLFDIVVWGTTADSPLIRSNPGFYKHEKGQMKSNGAGGFYFDWNCPGLRRWFKAVAVRFIEQTNADGFRVDLAPDISGNYFKEIRDELYARGRKVVIMSEMPNKNRGAFDFEENGVTGWTEANDFSQGYVTYLKQFRKFGAHNTYFLHHDIVEAVRTGVGIGHADLQKNGRGGMFRYYTSNILNHDDYKPFVLGNPVRFGYTSIFAPYIPIWYIGEEWNNPDGRQPPNDAQKKDPGSYVMYTNPIRWDWNPRQEAFYETIKQYIRIRRQHPLIFNHFALNARNANISKVNAVRIGTPNTLPAYARFGGGKAIVVVPNYADPLMRKFRVAANLNDLHLNPNMQLSVRDLNAQIVQNTPGQSAAEIESNVAGGQIIFAATVRPNHVGVYLIEPVVSVPRDAR